MIKPLFNLVALTLMGVSIAAAVSSTRTAWADSLQPINRINTNRVATHHITTSDDGSHTITGTDAYVIGRLDSLENANEQTLYIHIPEISGKADLVSFELFYKLITDKRFDAAYRVKFQAPLKQVMQNQGIYLSLPSSLTVTDQQALRLDIDQCHQCRLVLPKHPEPLFSLIEATSASITNQSLTPISRVYAGIAEVEPNGITVSLQGWNKNNLQGDPSGFQIDGDDPFFASPALAISTQDLAGLYFKLNVPNGNSEVNYQVFYATEAHQFIERASSLVGVSSNAGVSEFFLPLDYLTTQAPAHQLLDRIRLDIIPNESDINSPQPWSLQEVKAVPASQAENYATLKPKRIIQRKVQRSGKKALLLNSIKKIATDWPFAILYALLLLANVIFVVRLLRRKHPNKHG